MKTPLTLLALAIALTGCAAGNTLRPDWGRGYYYSQLYDAGGSGSSNPYGTPSPNLYMQPGPGTHITTAGGDMWSGRSTTPSGQSYRCFGAYGNVNCY